MDFSQPLTPFSNSILSPALALSLRRVVEKWGLSAHGIHADTIRSEGVNARLADLCTQMWGVSAPEVAHLLGTRPPTNAGRGKPGRVIKQFERSLQDFPQVYGALRSWARRVFVVEWQQAQLLQVMEEVEPKTTEALFWWHLSTLAAVGGYAYLGELIAKFEKDDVRAQALRLGLVSGLETPAGQLITALAAGESPAALQEAFGHMAVSAEGEIARPRLAEMAESLVGDQSPPEPLSWDLSQAQGRREDALAAARAAAGFMGRSHLSKVILFTQTALITQAKATDALAYVLAATRHWALAAAAEGMSDGRIEQMDEVFLLEIEEIKQMMTGEWHSRDMIAPLLAQRRYPETDAASEPSITLGPLGVAGERASGSLLPLTSPAEVAAHTPGFVALAPDWSPAWWRALLMAEGVLAADGNLLSWIATVARTGNLAAVVGCTACRDWPAGASVQLEPAQNRAELAK